MRPKTKAGRALMRDLLTNEHPFRPEDRVPLAEEIAAIEEEAAGQSEESVTLDIIYPPAMPYDEVPKLFETFYNGGVTPDSGTSKTWTYAPDEPSMSITVGPRQAVRTALWMLWQAIRHPRTPISYTMWSEPHPPYTVERDPDRAD